jgi:ATP-binding cassette subfamily B protein
MWGRYACVRQNDQSDCGAAALATVALHHRRPVGLEQFRDLTGTDCQGTNLLGLLRAAQRLGFAARGVKGGYEALPLAPLPAIAHLRTDEGLGHFVVLHRARADAVVIADPGRGVRRLPRAEFCRGWTGHLLLLAPDEAAPPTWAGAPPPGPWGRFLGLLRPHAGLLAEACACALLMTALGLATSYFLQHLVDSVLVRGETRLLNALGVGMACVLLFRALFGMVRQYLLAHIGRRVDLALVSGYARHVLRLPLRFFETRQVGDILSRVHDAGKVREAVSGTTLTALVDGTLVVLLVAVLWLYDLPLAALTTAFAPPLVLGALAHHPAARRGARAAMEKGALVSAHLVEDISGVETVKAFGAEDVRTESGERHLVGLVQAGFGLQKLGLSTEALGLVVTAGAGLAVLWYGGHRVIAGALTTGELMFFYSLLGFLLDPLHRLASLNMKVQDALVAVDRLYQVLDLGAERLAEPARARFAGVRQALTLENVGFRYGSRGPVLEGVNLRVPAGKTVAVVGESGSGKSTLLKLLMGFYAPTEGRVLVDGTDLRDFELASLRGRVGLVAQEPFVFSGSVRDNIALGRPGAPLEEVMAAARAAGLEEFINALPERYETVIGERGANLSGGQRQRLAIARALVRRPDVLIFDEATSHLDTATERAIQESLRTALAGKTVVLVAHRLSTVREADLIYVLARGRVAESGSHDELLARGGWYAGLWAAQTESRAAPLPSPLVRRLAAPAPANGAAHVEGTGHA